MPSSFVIKIRVILQQVIFRFPFVIFQFSFELTHSK
jgi:hypothetical protein